MKKPSTHNVVSIARKPYGSNGPRTSAAERDAAMGAFAADLFNPENVDARDRVDAHLKELAKKLEQSVGGSLDGTTAAHAIAALGALRGYLGVMDLAQGVDR